MPGSCEALATRPRGCAEGVSGFGLLSRRTKRSQTWGLSTAVNQTAGGVDVLVRSNTLFGLQTRGKRPCEAGDSDMRPGAGGSER
jgi:hypothetical protein